MDVKTRPAQVAACDIPSEKLKKALMEALGQIRYQQNSHAGETIATIKLEFTLASHPQK
jgi:hypothetical protein